MSGGTPVIFLSAAMQADAFLKAAGMPFANMTYLIMADEMLRHVRRPKADWETPVTLDEMIADLQKAWAKISAYTQDYTFSKGELPAHQAAAYLILKLGVTDYNPHWFTTAHEKILQDITDRMRRGGQNFEVSSGPERDILFFDMIYLKDALDNAILPKPYSITITDGRPMEDEDYHRTINNTWPICRLAEDLAASAQRYKGAFPRLAKLKPLNMD